MLPQSLAICSPLPSQLAVHSNLCQQISCNSHRARFAGRCVHKQVVDRRPQNEARYVSGLKALLACKRRLNAACRASDNCSADAENLSQDAEDELAPVPRRFVQALVLAWSASRGRSLFAARCLVAVALELHGRGATATDVQLALSFADMQAGGQLLAGDERDVLTSWTALIFLAAEEAGLPCRFQTVATATQQHPGSNDRQSQASDSEQRGSDSSSSDGGSGNSMSSMSLGMRRFVKQAAARFAGGTRLGDLIQLQASAGTREEDIPPSVRLMQQNTRLIILTLQLLEEAGVRLQLPEPLAVAPPTPPGGSPLPLPTEVPPAATAASGQPAGSPAAEDQRPQRVPDSSQLQQEGQSASAVAAAASREVQLQDPIGYVVAFPAAGDDPPGARSAAVRLLISYMGAVLQAQYSAEAFAEGTVRCYRQGFTASELYEQLAAEEFEQQGGLLAIALQSSPRYATVTAELFARWLSIAYMTLAQLGVPRPGLDTATGWAWAGSSSLEASRLADFVSNTLHGEMHRSTPGLDSRAVEALAAAQAQRSTDLPPQQQQAPADFVLAKLEDPSLKATSSSAVALWQQIDIIRLVAQHAERAGLLPQQEAVVE